jgi:hypothetical protein
MAPRNLKILINDDAEILDLMDKIEEEEEEYGQKSG